MKRSVFAWGFIFLCGVAGFFSAPVVLPPSSTPNVYVSGTQDKAFFDRAYTEAGKQTRVTARSAIVAHHLLVSDKIAAVFSTLSSRWVKTVVLISPNHFSAGSSTALVSTGTWQTPYGDVASDVRAVEALRKEVPFLRLEERAFPGEHGIGALTPFVARSFPRANIVPLMLHDRLSEADRVALGEAIARTLPHAVVIASIDMSHYLPRAAQEFHDTTTLHALATARPATLEIDANAVLATLQSLNRARQTEEWHLMHHGSVLMSGLSRAAAENTSHILGYFSAGAPVSAPQANLHFVGDIMLDRGVRQQIEREGADWPWAQVERLLSGSDLVIGNLEGTVGDRPSIAQDMLLRFTMDPAAVAEAAKHVDVFSQANNHAADFGAEGEEETRRQLTAMGVPFFGSWDTPMPRFDTEQGGIRLSFIGYHQFRPNEQALVQQITEAEADGRFVIVLPHWGTEYALTPDATQRRLAQLMVDAGADLIVGAHPHVVQPVETLDGVPVAYSLGNFIFDQGFGDTRNGLTLGVTITDTSVILWMIPVATLTSQPALIDEPLRPYVLHFSRH